ncbi:MAG: inorganic phosphate transporter [Tidjanibacter sp.]|nr:inorganic phosphate transporter [Tidjanibacter sp.]
MLSIYTFIVVVLLLLAIGGLYVGVSNDAVNFLNSALGSKAAPKKVILAVASVGIVIGALTSSGMMEVARSGVYYPEFFTFHEVMMLFTGVMFANVILLDVFNSLGLPTSTTVALVFGLLGSAIAVSIFKEPVLSADGTPETLINSGKALAMIAAILLSVVLAFITGTVLMFLSRLLFTFRYHKQLRRFGALWCGVAFTIIAYFALIKGLKSSGLATDLVAYIHDHTAICLLIVFAVSSLLMFVLQKLKVNILKITILAGTFSLALAFAGNDLVNFIGVPLAGLDSWKIVRETGDPDMLMGALNNPVKADTIFLIIAGAIMIVTLWSSKKTQNVSDTELSLSSSQDDGAEKFGSSAFSRAIVRVAVTCSRWFEDHTPKSWQNAVARRFEAPAASELASDHGQYDLIRAAVNLTAGSMLIIIGTSLQLPLSTTYVTFMVAMGSSLADKAWGRESAVYRITGVITVVAGWFVTGLAAFVLSIVITLLLLWGGVVAIVVLSILCVYMMLPKKSKKKEEEKESVKVAFSDDQDEALGTLILGVCQTMQTTTDIYAQTIDATLKEDRKALRSLVRQSNDLFYAARERKYAMLPTLHKFHEENYIDTGHYYVQVVDYISEMCKALVHITRPCYEHIDNNHRGMSEEQVEDLTTINNSVSELYSRINDMLQANDFANIDLVLAMRDELFDLIAQAIKNQLRRIQNNSTSTKASMLYLTILNETKTMVLQSRNLLKSQKYFVEAQKTEAR